MRVSECCGVMTYLCVSLALLIVPQTLPASSPAGVMPEDAPHVAGRVLVQLATPLGEPDEGGRFGTVTGQPGLDELLVEGGIREIRWTMRVSLRDRDHRARHQLYGLDRIYTLEFPAGVDVIDLARRLEEFPGVIYAEPDAIFTASAMPDDPRFGEQWGLHQDSDADMDAPEAWDITMGREDAVIAILDSGCDSDHEDLAGKLTAGYDIVNDDNDPEDDNGHGTEVASVAAAATNNGLGMAGVCPGCRIMPVKCMDADGNITTSDSSDAAIWAADHGADVINASWGGSGGPYYTGLRGIAYAYDAGVVYIAASGNTANSSVDYPSRYVEALSVGATLESDERALWSNYGPRIDVTAPGNNTLYAEMGGGYGTGSGTSYSTPAVAGLVGLLQAITPSLGREEVRHLIRSGAEDEVGRFSEDTPGFDLYHGWGRVNMDRTLRAAQSAPSLRVEGKDSTRVYLETANPLADSYDFARGDVSAFTESARDVGLGDLLCLENDSTDPDTAGNEDSESPPPGGAFFYVARPNTAPGAGSYGGSSRNRDRRPLETGTAPAWAAESDQEGALFGIATYRAGDVNADGFSDVIVTAPDFDGLVTDGGRVYVFHGGPSGVAATPAWTVDGDQEGAEFGWTAATAGDVNGDGYDDVIFGTSEWSHGQTDEGKAWVYHGSSSGLEEAAAWTDEPDLSGAHYAHQVRTAGDVDGDGYDEVIVAAYGVSNPESEEGRAYVYFGSETGLEANASWTFEPNEADTRFGVGVGTAGDVNGDGYDDVVVGAPLYGLTNNGRLYVFHGSALGLPATPSTVIDSPHLNSRLGYTAITAGDVNGDGYDDILGGAFLYTNGESSEGAVFVYYGSASGVSITADWSFESDQRDANLGFGAESAGDVNSDGYDDIVVGTHYFDRERTNNGQAWLFFGSASGLAVEPSWRGTVWQSGAKFGFRPAGAGDVNGDGVDDLIVGAYQEENGQFQEGRAYVYHGPIIKHTATDCPH